MKTLKAYENFKFDKVTKQTNKEQKYYVAEQI